MNNKLVEEIQEILMEYIPYKKNEIQVAQALAEWVGEREKDVLVRKSQVHEAFDIVRDYIKVLTTPTLTITNKELIKEDIEKIQKDIRTNVISGEQPKRGLL